MGKSYNTRSSRFGLWLGLAVLLVLGLGACSADSSGFGAEEAGDAPSDNGNQDVEVQPGLLTAGEWRDLDHWQFWRELVGPLRPFEHMESLWGYDTSRRMPVLVLDASEQPVVDAQVVLSDRGTGELVWVARTDNQGRAELFVDLFELAPHGELVDLVLEADAGRASARLEGASTGQLQTLVLDNAAPAPELALDLMFVIDTTGSMGDELGYLQAELEDVIERVKQSVGAELRVRLSVNFYRDEGDAYVLRDHAFTQDVEKAVAVLRQESAAGGGDYPEAFDVGLSNAIEEHQWSESARSRMLFVLLDAPPHSERAGVVERIQAANAEAARKGVRIFPIAASGINKETEFLMRLLDVSTGGSYIFLTDDSGIGDAHLEPTVGDYDVEPLNDLLVRLIGDSLR